MRRRHFLTTPASWSGAGTKNWMAVSWSGAPSILVILLAGGFTDPRPDSQIPLGTSKGIPIHRRVSRLSQAWEVTVSDVGRAPGAASEDQELGSAAANRELSLDERAELERLRAEVEHLHADMAGRPSQQVNVVRRRHGWRTPVSVVLIVLGCLLAPVAVISVWAGDEVSNTGRYVATVESLIHTRPCRTT